MCRGGKSHTESFIRADLLLFNFLELLTSTCWAFYSTGPPDDKERAASPAWLCAIWLTQSRERQHLLQLELCCHWPSLGLLPTLISTCGSEMPSANRLGPRFPETITMSRKTELSSFRLLQSHLWDLESDQFH